MEIAITLKNYIKSNFNVIYGVIFILFRVREGHLKANAKCNVGMAQKKL